VDVDEFRSCDGETGTKRKAQALGYGYAIAFDKATPTVTRDWGGGKKRAGYLCRLVLGIDHRPFLAIKLMTIDPFTLGR
jgi:hypothetical protein